METATRRYDKMIIIGTLLVIFYLGLAYMWVSDEGCKHRMEILKDKCQTALDMMALRCGGSIDITNLSNINSSNWWEYEKTQKEIEEEKS